MQVELQVRQNLLGTLFLEKQDLHLKQSLGMVRLLICMNSRRRFHRRSLLQARVFVLLAGLASAAGLLGGGQHVLSIDDGSTPPAQASKVAVSAFSPQQLSALNPDKISAFQASDVAALSPSSLWGLQIAALTKAQVAALTVSQIPALTTQQFVAVFKMLAVDKLSSVISAQVSALPPAIVTALSSDQVNVMVPKFSAAQGETLSCRVWSHSQSHRRTLAEHIPPPPP